MFWCLNTQIISHKAAIFSDTDPNVFDDEDADLFSCHYCSVETNYLILIDVFEINLYNDVQLKQFKIRVPELKSEKLYHVVKWHDDDVDYCSLFGIFVPSFVNIVKNSDSSYGFTCEYLSTDSAPAFLASKLQGRGQTIYMGLAFAAYKSLPAFSCMEFLAMNHYLQGYRIFYHDLQTYNPLYNKDASDHIIERHQQQSYDNSVSRIVKLTIQEKYVSFTCYLVLEAYFNNSTKTLVDPT